MVDNCIHCQHPVRAKQQGIQCDGCLKWNHRTCNTGISQQQYRAAVRAGAEILWFCAPSRSSSRKLTSVRGVRYFWPVELHFGVGGVQSSTRVVRPVHDLRSTSPGRSYTFFFSPSDRNLTLRTLYCSLVRLNLEYFSVMWSPYTISCLTGISPCVLFNKWLPNK